MSRQGMGKRLPVRSLRLANRGDLGQALQFVAKTDAVVGLVPAYDGTSVTVLTSGDRLARLPAESFPSGSTSGEKLLKLTKTEVITTLIPALLPAEDETEASEDDG